MTWFNYFGLIIVVVIMLPNIVYAVTCKEGFQNAYRNQPAEIIEQIGRYGCMAFMIFNIPYTWFGYWFANAETVYLAVNFTLAAAYCLIWIVFWKRQGICKAVLLSVIPSLIFLFSAAVIASIPLGVFAVIFTVCHILISVKNASASK